MAFRFATARLQCFEGRTRFVTSLILGTRDSERLLMRQKKENVISKGSKCSFEGFEVDGELMKTLAPWHRRTRIFGSRHFVARCGE